MQFHKTSKSVLLGMLEDYAVDTPSSLPTQHDSSSSTAYIIDAMALIRMIKIARGTATFGDLATKYYAYLASKFVVMDATESTLYLIVMRLSLSSQPNFKREEA